MPTFFLAGTPKGGTNQLLSILATHPEVFVPEGLKEPMYFFWHGCDVEHHGAARLPTRRRHHRDLDAYRALFAPGAGRPAIGEGSVHYLASVRAARNVRAAVPDARILLLLRDPVERALSHHAFNVARGLEPRPFWTAVEDELADAAPERIYPTYRYVGNGLYGRHLAHWRDLFPSEQVLPLLFEDLVDDVAAVVGRAERHIGVPEGGSDVAGGDRHQTVDGGLVGVTRHLRTSEGPLGAGARWLDRVAGASAPYRALRRGVRAATRRTTRTPAPRPELPDERREQLAELFTDDAALLARLSGLDLARWRSVAPLVRTG